MAGMIHRPKFMQSRLPYGGSKNTVVTSYISESCIVTSEFWHDSPKPIWKIGQKIIARKNYTWKTQWELGKHFVLTTVYDATGEKVGTYWDIGSQVQKLSESFAYEDWYLDVWLPEGGSMQLLDEAELEEAVEKHYISLADADTAKWTAYRIMELKTQQD